MQDISALFKVYLWHLWGNKFAFIYNLIIPTGFFLYHNMNAKQPIAQHMTPDTLATLSFFWSYIIVVTLLNNLVVTLIAHRELGLYKQLFFIAGSKMKLITALFLVQLLLLNIEILLFNAIVFIISQHVSLAILLSGVGVSLISALPITLICSVLFLFKIKIESINILCGLLLFGLFFFTGLPTRASFHAGMILFNPINYVAEIAFQTLGLFYAQAVNGSIWTLLLLVSIVYAVIGTYAITRLTVQPLSSRA